MNTDVPEKTIALVWQRQVVANLVTDAGEQLRIVYPGRTSNGSGCDFTDAVFTIDGKVIEGDIEIHVKSSQWYSHGHHRDVKYNNIVLHVVMWRDSQSPTLLQNGKIIPTICLSSFLRDSLDRLRYQPHLFRHPLPSCPQAPGFSNTESLSKSLTTAGEERFAAKATSFHTGLNQEAAGQVLFRGMSRALGYAQNAEPCEELTHKLLLSFLQKVEPQTTAVKQAWILGTAGLLPSQRLKLRYKPLQDAEIEELETIWQSSGAVETMKETDWCFFRVRPDNFPTRRLIALSYILARYRKPGLLLGILELVRKAPSEAEHCWLENGLTIASQGYWANHFDFGVPKKRSSALLGREKAASIAINAILPFVYAWSDTTAQPELKRKAAGIYHSYPKLGDNELTRHMKQQLLLERDADLSACQQQGLIHIFKKYCRHRNCSQCPVAPNPS
ncbi:MAG: DUF2851 family protein [Dehalococcoidia bacterium]|nr:DUF2851 family protein [Dehalococcoidia bacterium]